MSESFENRIIGLINRVFVLSIDFVSFIRSMEKDGFEGGIIILLRSEIGKFSNQISDLEDEKENVEIIAGLEKSSNFAARILEHLQKIQCKNLLLNEKTDLTLRMFKIIEETEEIINIFKKEITQ
jgi:hypothetical protein